MRFLLALAMKNVLRYKRRTVLTFLVLTVAVCLFIFMTGLYDGMEEATVANYVDFESGHLQIVNAAFDEDAPFSSSNFLADPAKVEKSLDSAEFVVSHVRRVQFPAEADNGVDSVPCLVTGIDPASDSRVFSLTNYLLKGSAPAPGKDSVFLGSGLAKDLGIGLNGTFYLTFRDESGMIDSVPLRVAGLLDAPDPMINSSGVIVTMAEAARFLGKPSTSFVAVKIRDWKNDRKRGAELDALLPGYRARTWHEMAQAVLAVSATKQKFSSAIVLFLILIAMVGIINTMLMSVFEKTREIGTLKAMGMRDRDVLRLFLFEGSIVGTLGAVCGVIGGCLMTWYFAVHGMDFSSMAKGIDTSSLRMGTVIYSTWNIPSIVGSFVMCVGLSLLASWYPAKKAVAMQAAECLRTN